MAAGAGLMPASKAPSLTPPNPLYSPPAAGTSKSYNSTTLAPHGKPAAADDDDEETFFERLSDSAFVQRLNAAADRIFQNYTVAVLMDVVGVLLFFFDIYTDALVVDVRRRSLINVCCGGVPTAAVSLQNPFIERCRWTDQRYVLASCSRGQPTD